MGRKRGQKENDYLPKRRNPLQETVCYRLGRTVCEAHTSCGGTELLYDKMVRLIRSEAVTAHAEKEGETQLKVSTCLLSVHYKKNDPDSKHQLF